MATLTRNTTACLGTEGEVWHLERTLMGDVGAPHQCSLSLSLALSQGCTLTLELTLIRTIALWHATMQSHEPGFQPYLLHKDQADSCQDGARC